MTLTDAYEYLAADLEQNTLEVELFPAPVMTHPTHCIRVAVSRNPQWYRRLVREYPSVRRVDVFRVLGALAQSKRSRAQFTAFLQGEAEAIVERFPF